MQYIALLYVFCTLLIYILCSRISRWFDLQIKPINMDFLNVGSLPIGIQEHILCYIDDITLIPDGLNDNFWKKWFKRNGVKPVMFASWKKSAQIVKDLSKLDVKRKALAVLDWSHIYVGTLADITIGKYYAEYAMKKEVIAAAGNTGLCMLVEPVNFNAENHLDISPRGSQMHKYYTGKFAYTGYVSYKKRPRNQKKFFSPGVRAWYYHSLDRNECFDKVAHTLFKIFNMDFLPRHAQDAAMDRQIDEDLCSESDDECSDYPGYGITPIPMMSQSLVFTKDPYVFEKPHCIKMWHEKNNICAVRDEHGELKAFIVCMFKWKMGVENLICIGDQLCYFISDRGNIYFEQNDIYSVFKNRF